MKCRPTAKPPTYEETLIRAQAAYAASVTDFIPKSGMKVTAWTDNGLCAETLTKEIDGEIVYTMKIEAKSDGNRQGCGSEGSRIQILVDEVPMIIEGTWDNTRVNNLPLISKFDYS